MPSTTAANTKRKPTTAGNGTGGTAARKQPRLLGPEDDGSSASFTSLTASTPELIVKISTFVDIGGVCVAASDGDAVSRRTRGAATRRGRNRNENNVNGNERTNDMMHFCIVVGPAMSRMIRHEWLHENVSYLAHFMLREDALYSPTGRTSFRSKARAWMAENPEWRSFCVGVGTVTNETHSQECDNLIIHSPDVASRMKFKTSRIAGKDFILFDGWDDSDNDAPVGEVMHDYDGHSWEWGANDIPTKIGDVMMSINDWNWKHASGENSLSDVLTQDSTRLRCGDDAGNVSLMYMKHPHLLFRSPERAIYYGLVEVLQHLVESKVVSVNDYTFRWKLIDHHHNLRFKRILEFTDYPLVGLSLLFHPPEKNIVEYLLSIHGIDLNVQITYRSFWDEDRDVEIDEEETALLTHEVVMCSELKSKLFRLFITHPKVDPNEVNDTRDTPLHHLLKSWPSAQCCNKFALDRVKTLLDAGADPRLENSDGNSSIQVAELSIQVAELLLVDTRREDVPEDLKRAFVAAFDLLKAARSGRRDNQYG